jgi:hypothetical protein
MTRIRRICEYVARRLGRWVEEDELMVKRMRFSLGEQTSSLFQLDPFCWGDFFDTFKRTAYLEPERF